MKRHSVRNSEQTGQPCYHYHQKIKIMNSEDQRTAAKNIVIIHGQNHQGTTCHIARTLADKIGGHITEFFLPNDFGEYCVGCSRCFLEGETKCPHYDRLTPITKAIDEADIIILASPVYVYHATGAMKTLLDHYGWRWIIHRPDERMFHKQAVVITAAAAAGIHSADKDMSDSLFFWGVAKIHHIGIRVFALKWDSVSQEKKDRIEQETSSLAAKIKRTKPEPGLKTKALFYLVRLMRKHGIGKADVEYWKEKGWMDHSHPW